jgi:hypothetical protein
VKTPEFKLGDVVWGVNRDTTWPIVVHGVVSGLEIYPPFQERGYTVKYLVNLGGRFAYGCFEEYTFKTQAEAVEKLESLFP